MVYSIKEFQFRMFTLLNIIFHEQMDKHMEDSILSIKGTRNDLFAGKTECNIITFRGNKLTIDYEDLKRINYSYHTPGKDGYINFVDSSGKIIQFGDKNKLNDEKIKRTIDLIHENRNKTGNNRTA